VKVLPTVVTGLRALRPKLEVVLFETEDNADLLDRAASGAVDVTFAVGPVWDERLEVVRLGLDPFVAIVAADHPLAASEVFPLHDLNRAPTIGLEGGTACQMMIENGLLVSGVRPSYVFRSNDNGAVQAMVAAGVGTAVMPRLTVNRADPAVRVLPLEPPLPPREIAVAYSRSQPLPAVGDDFIELARSAVRQQGVLPLTSGRPAVAAARARG
jgi:DNA-binding transcriptional LysR family regulator